MFVSVIRARGRDRNDRPGFGHERLEVLSPPPLNRRRIGVSKERYRFRFRPRLRAQTTFVALMITAQLGLRLQRTSSLGPKGFSSHLPRTATWEGRATSRFLPAARRRCHSAAARLCSGGDHLFKRDRLSRFCPNVSLGSFEGLTSSDGKNYYDVFVRA